MNRQYTGVDRSTQLRHWKYIKKKRGKNGKWIYYYDKEKLKDDLGFDEREAAREAEKSFRASRMKESIAKENMNKGFDGKKHISDGKDMNERKAIAKRAQDNYKKANAETVENATKYTNALKKYAKTPLGKLDSFINKGANFLEKLFG